MISPHPRPLSAPTPSLPVHGEGEGGGERLGVRAA